MTTVGGTDHCAATKIACFSPSHICHLCLLPSTHFTVEFGWDSSLQEDLPDTSMPWPGFETSTLYAVIKFSTDHSVSCQPAHFRTLKQTETVCCKRNLSLRKKCVLVNLNIILIKYYFVLQAYLVGYLASWIPTLPILHHVPCSIRTHVCSLSSNSHVSLK